MSIRGRKRRDDLVREPGRQKGLPPSHTRFSFIIRVETLERLRKYAKAENLTIKDAMEIILVKYLDEYEKTHEIIHRPKED